MNEVSAAEAVKLFELALRDVDWDRDPKVYIDDEGLPRCPDPRRFPKDVAAKDFLESLVLYRQIRMDGLGADEMGIPYEYDEQIGEVANIAANIPEKSLEELVTKLGPPQRKVFDRIVDGSHPRLKDFVTDTTLISDETGKQMAEGTIRFHVSTICNLFGVPTRKALFDRVKAEKHPPK